MPRLLVANRGEIAVRIFATARRMGWHTIAVHSKADAGALHVGMADVAVPLGGDSAEESYLAMDRLLAAARRSGATHLHPGYGFLSENADFARAVLDAGLIWVGPGPDTIATMGDKAKAKALMERVGVPVIPGLAGTVGAEEISSFPLPFLIKAVAGGGGKGMRLVRDREEAGAALERARSEAGNAFGNDAVLVEAWIESPRHIEAQIFADGEDFCCLGLRDCSVQRRYQKIIEEAPAPGLCEALQQSIREAAILAAGSVGYVGAGTVEFVLDQRQRFHFLEMNTRLQVEHTVTEEITGIDLVEWQLRVAEGESIAPLHKVRSRGHAIQARLCAEDENGLPAPATAGEVRPPAGLRWDGGLASGGTVSGHYDPMFAKLIAHGRTRDEAVEKLRVGLFHAECGLAQTNRGLLMNILSHPEFARGAVGTDFFAQRDWNPKPRPAVAALYLALACHRESLQADQGALGGNVWGNDGFRMSGSGLFFFVAPDGALLRVRRQGRMFACLDHDENLEIISHRPLRVRRNGEACGLHLRRRGENGIAWLDGQGFGCGTLQPMPQREAGDPTLVLAPMTARLVALHASEGSQVAAGDALFTLEAMKSELTVCAAIGGAVAEILVAPGDAVNRRDLCLRLECDP